MKAYQKSQQLEVDGIAGPDTLGRIDFLRGAILDKTAGPVDAGLRGAVIEFPQRWAATSGGGEQGECMGGARMEASAWMAHLMRRSCTAAPEVPRHL